MTAAGNPDVYAYRFDWDEEPTLMGYDLSVALGAAHALEIGFVFGEFDGIGLGYVYPDDENQRSLMESMMSYWAEFAYTRVAETMASMLDMPAMACASMSVW